MTKVRRGGWVHVIPYGEDDLHELNDDLSCPCDPEPSDQQSGVIEHNQLLTEGSGDAS